MQRCPLCAGLSRQSLFSGYARCTLCSLATLGDQVLLQPFDAALTRPGLASFPNWNNLASRLLRRVPNHWRPQPLFSLPTVEMFAYRDGFRVTALRTSLPGLPRVSANWRHGPLIRARVERRNQTAPSPQQQKADSRLTLGIIAGRDSTPAVLALCSDMAGLASNVIVVLDTPETAPASMLERTLGAMFSGAVQVVAAPLNRDFAAQRNRIQHHARTEWVLQLDCDERLEPAAKEGLPALIDDAEARRWDVVALTRINLVDGHPSALYPDIQNRLLRRSIRFTRPVHEYPVVGPAQRAFTYLGPGILHHLESARFDRREAFYEAIQETAGRPNDTALLRMPLEPGLIPRLSP